MQAQEGIENQKLNKLYPSSDGLADCKTTTRDFLTHNKICIYQLFLKKDFEHFKLLVLPYMQQSLLYKLSLNHVNLGKSGDR